MDEAKGSRQNIEASKEGQQGIGADIAEIKLLQSLPWVGQIDTVQAGQHDRDPQPFALFIK